MHFTHVFRPVIRGLAADPHSNAHTATAPPPHPAVKSRWLLSELFTVQTSKLADELRCADPAVYDMLLHSLTLQDARIKLNDHLGARESELFDLLSPGTLSDLNITERSNAKECIRVLKNIIRTENERLTAFSALQALRNAVINRHSNSHSPSHAFLAEFIALLRGMNGEGLSFLAHEDEAATTETASFHPGRLDQYAAMMNRGFEQFSSGSDPVLVARHEAVRKRILDYHHATDADWNDYRWHLKHLFTAKGDIASIVHLSPEEIAGLDRAQQEGIAVQITPYYLTLFNPEGRDHTDRAVRAQVLPSVMYCRSVSENRANGTDMDFMGEHETSPIEGITRRYPNIVILKPFDSCPQICVYCQRNWEIRDIGHGGVSETKVQRAIQWIRNHPEITEVLVTGGDPLTLGNDKLGLILERLADIDHIERIRIGTRTLVTMPCRIDDGFVKLLQAYHQPGRREVVVMTHVEHASELTPAVVAAAAKIRRCGVGVYNQQVFTYYNSRKYETAFLRKKLRLCGIDPYYTFNTKGKEETADFRVPIARLLQERKEEARLLPGVARTDEPVFNVPRLGKSHLRSWQDHEPIMILADGRRVYRFLPWESRLTLTQDYLYTDVPIYDYLKRLHMDGEDVDQYRTIWYYF